MFRTLHARYSVTQQCRRDIKLFAPPKYYAHDSVLEKKIKAALLEPTARMNIGI
jgi:hypothetical protein